MGILTRKYDFLENEQRQNRQRQHINRQKKHSHAEKTGTENMLLLQIQINHTIILRESNRMHRYMLLLCICVAQCNLLAGIKSGSKYV